VRRLTLLGAIASAGLTAGGAILAVSGGSAQAATLPTAGLTALHALEVAGSVLAKRVLITERPGRGSRP